MSEIDTLLSRLDGVKPTAPNKWLAKCPAHDDRNASFAIKLTDDDTILLKCWAGCPTESVLSAVGLTFNDLFPKKTAFDIDPTKPRAKPPKFTPREMLEKCIFESTLLAIAYEGVADAYQTLTGDYPFDDENHARVQQAIDTLDEIRKEAAYG